MNLTAKNLRILCLHWNSIFLFLLFFLTQNSLHTCLCSHTKNFLHHEVNHLEIVPSKRFHLQISICLCHVSFLLRNRLYMFIYGFYYRDTHYLFAIRFSILLRRLLTNCSIILLHAFCFDEKCHHNRSYHSDSSRFLCPPSNLFGSIHHIFIHWRTCIHLDPRTHHLSSFQNIHRFLDKCRFPSHFEVYHVWVDHNTCLHLDSWPMRSLADFLVFEGINFCGDCIREVRRFYWLVNAF